MIRKCLIALAILSMFTGEVAQGHPGWGVTVVTEYEWAKKQHEVQVYMQMVRWAELYVELAITMVQQGPEDVGDNGPGLAVGDFFGCTWIEVCNNFYDLMVEARIVPISGDIAENWYLSLTESGYHSSDFSGDVPPQVPATRKPWDENSTSEVVDDGEDGDNNTSVNYLNLTGNHGWLHLCVKATGVDPQRLEFDPGSLDPQKAADIYLTYYPATAPGLADSVNGSPDMVYDDNVNVDDIYWNETDGGGGGVPTGTNVPNQFPVP